VQTPADDPVAAVHILELQRALQESDQFGKNADAASNRLTLEEHALADVGTLMQRVHELAIQANNASVDSAGRRIIATEIRERLDELTGIANRRDGNGEYLFAGYSTLTKPFEQTGATTTYFGDQGSRSLQVSATQKVSDSHSGYEVFMKVPEGNGTFVIGAAQANTGSGVMSVGSVVDQTQWVADDYTVNFTSASGDYEILDGAANVVTTGVYTAGSTLSFNGVNVGMTGMPADGDSFTVSRSRSEDIFTTLNDLISTLEGTNVGSQAQFNTDMGRMLQQLDQSSDHLINVRAQVGSRLSSLDAAAASRDDREVELKRMTSELHDLDYAEAISRMNQQLLGLEAAQASYSRISQLSLFNYLR
jgi:flagellar hook-associated protein 3 FlgL